MCAPSGVVFVPLVETLMTRLSMLPGDGSRHGGPVKRRQKMRAGIGVTPSSTGP